MGAQHSVPASLLRTPVAQVVAGGELRPLNDAMRAWIATAAGHIDGLRLSDDQRNQLRRGERVAVEGTARSCELELATADGEHWLFVHEGQDRTVELSAARCRALGGMAGSLAHDLNNQLNQLFALTSCLGPLATDPEDQQVIAELEASTKLGGRVAANLARMLASDRRRGRVEAVALDDVLADALSLHRKDLEIQGVELNVEGRADVQVRIASLEAVQAVHHGIASLQACSPETMTLSVLSEDRAIAGGRVRACAVVRCEAHPISRRHVEQLRTAIAGREGSLATVANHADLLAGVAGAALAQRCAGGELLIDERADGGARLDYVWPAASSARA